MTKKYWLGVMLFSLLIALGSGFFIWTTLQQKSTVEVPLKNIVKDVPAPTPVPVTQFASTQSIAEVPVSIEKEVSEEKPKQVVQSSNPKLGKRNILFSYRKASAQEVFLIGTFNKWTRETMKKNEKGFWQVSLKLAPGTYEYRYVVDNRKIRDPNNRLFTPEGNSILKVKPLADK